MSKQIAVTIPDELHERLQAVKGSFNVSGICQQAIERAVTLEEIKSEEIPQMDQLIAKLRLQKEGDAEQWRQIGFKEGRKSAHKLNLSDFRLMSSLLHTDYNVQPPVVKPYPPQDFCNTEVGQRISARFFEKYGLEKGNLDAYTEGWIMGALSVWDEIKDDI